MVGAASAAASPPSLDASSWRLTSERPETPPANLPLLMRRPAHLLKRLARLLVRHALQLDEERGHLLDLPRRGLLRDERRGHLRHRVEIEDRARLKLDLEGVADA